LVANTISSPIASTILETKKLSDSSLRERQLVRSDELTSEEREQQIEETLRATEGMTDEDIDVSDIPETTPEQWAKAERGKFYRPIKDQVTLRIDRPVLEWFRVNHEHYQTAINQVLLDHMRAERLAEMRRRSAEEDAALGT